MVTANGINGGDVASPPDPLSLTPPNGGGDGRRGSTARRRLSPAHSRCGRSGGGGGERPKGGGATATRDLTASLHDLSAKPALAPAAAAETSPGEEAASAKSPCVFIGHGRSKLWAELKLHVESDLRTPTTEYESAGCAGMATMEILRNMLDEATFAALILTAEHETVDGAKRARQNVVHGAGLFQGRLGFDKAVLMIQDGVEEFSNIHGLQHIKFTGDNIKGAFYELRRAMAGAGVL